MTDQPAFPATADGAAHADLAAQSQALTRRVAVAVGRAFCLFTEQQQSQRHNLYGLSMSGLGGCSRRAAYALAEVPPSDPAAATTGENRAANLGTMIHAGYLPALASVLGAREEIRIDLAVDAEDRQVVIPGRSDLYWPGEQLLLDLKTVGGHKLSARVADGPTWPHRVQVCGYALGAEQQGHPVRWVGWLYMDRATGEAYVIIEPFTDEQRQLVVDRCIELVNYAAFPHDAPRDGPGPGSKPANAMCNGCPWLRECWGPTAQPGVAGAQSTKVDDFGGMEQVLAAYIKARDAEAAASDRKDFYRELFRGNEQGVYGRAQWRLTRPSRTVDKNACVDMVRADGREPPRRTGEPRLMVSWVVPDQTGEGPGSTTAD